MNAEKLKTFMTLNRIEPEEMAEAADMSLSTWYRKMQRKGDTFSVKEMNAMIQKGKMTKDEAAEIFFNEKLAKMRAG